jgi:hypothetical protein
MLSDDTLPDYSRNHDYESDDTLPHYSRNHDYDE